MKKLRIFLTVFALIFSIGSLTACREESSNLEKEVVVNKVEEKKPSNIKAKPDQKPEEEKEDEDDDDDLIEEVVDRGKKIVVIDAGHQRQGIYEHEPIGPGATQTKPKLASGTEGVVTGVPEYQLTLDVSLKLRDELERRGYEVVMIREDNNCPLSNKQRAEIANKYEGQRAVFIRIHANSVGDQTVSGILTICPAPNNPYTPEIIVDSRRLSEDLLHEMVKETGANDMGIIETNSMSGINWCRIPVSIVEMGFMSNKEEDKKMQTKEYQEFLVDGMSQGLDEYFGLQ